MRIYIHLCQADPILSRRGKAHSGVGVCNLFPVYVQPKLDSRGRLPLLQPIHQPGSQVLCLLDLKLEGSCISNSMITKSVCIWYQNCWHWDPLQVPQPDLKFLLTAQYLTEHEAEAAPDWTQKASPGAAIQVEG